MPAPSVPLAAGPWGLVEGGLVPWVERELEERQEGEGRGIGGFEGAPGRSGKTDEMG